METAVRSLTGERKESTLDEVDRENPSKTSDAIEHELTTAVSHTAHSESPHNMDTFGKKEDDVPSNMDTDNSANSADCLNSTPTALLYETQSGYQAEQQHHSSRKTAGSPDAAKDIEISNTRPTNTSQESRADTDTADASDTSRVESTDPMKSIDQEHSQLVLMEHPTPENVLSLVPSKLQQRFWSVNVSITSMDADGIYILFGTNAGCGFLHNRETGGLVKILCESRSDIMTTVKLSVGIECQTALGSEDGKITILILSSSAAMSAKQIQKFQLGKIHNSEITCMEWSNNGLKLYSGDKNGNIYQVERDFEKNSCNVSLVHTEKESIVDLSYRHMILLISTTERTLLFHTNRTQDQLKPIGSKSRQGVFGACFTPDSVSSSELQVFCSRPGYRIWIADVEGKVTNTLLLKNLVSSPHPDIKMENELPELTQKDQQLRKITFFKDKYIVAHSETSVFVIDPSTPSIVSSNQELSDILDVAIANDEIFILRKNRQFHRIAENSDEIAIKRKRMAEEEKKKETQSLNLQDVRDSIFEVKKSLTPLVGALHSRMSNLNEETGLWTQKLKSQAKVLQEKLPLFSRDDKNNIPLLDVRQPSPEPDQNDNKDQNTHQNENSSGQAKRLVPGNDSQKLTPRSSSPSQSSNDSRESFGLEYKVSSCIESHSPSLDPEIVQTDDRKKKLPGLKTAEQDFLHSQGHPELLKTTDMKDQPSSVNFHFEKLERISSEDGGDIVFNSKRKKKSRTVSSSSGKQSTSQPATSKLQPPNSPNTLTYDLHSSRTDISTAVKGESSEDKVPETIEPRQHVLIVRKTFGNQLCPKIVDLSDIVMDDMVVPHNPPPHESHDHPFPPLSENNGSTTIPSIKQSSPVLRSEPQIGDKNHILPPSTAPTTLPKPPLNEEEPSRNTTDRNEDQVEPSSVPGCDISGSPADSNSASKNNMFSHGEKVPLEDTGLTMNFPAPNVPLKETIQVDVLTSTSKSQPKKDAGAGPKPVAISSSKTDKIPAKIFPKRKNPFSSSAVDSHDSQPLKYQMSRSEVLPGRVPLFLDSDEEVLQNVSHELEKFDSSVPSSMDDIYCVDSSRVDFGSEFDSEMDEDHSNQEQLSPAQYKPTAGVSSQSFINEMMNEISSSVPVKLLDSWSASELPHQVASISGSDSYIWYIDMMNNISITEKCGSEWMKLAKKGTQLCISPSGAVAWLVGKSGKVRAAVMPVELHLMEEPVKLNWQLVDSSVQHAALGHDSAWVVTTNGNIKAQFGISISYPFSKSWTLVPWNNGKIADIIATKSAVWCRTDQGKLFVARIDSIDSNDFKWEEVEVPPDTDGSPSWIYTMTADSRNILFLTDNKGILWFVTEDRKWWQVNVSEYIEDDSYAFMQSLHLPTSVTTSVYKVQRWMSGLIRSQHVAVNNQSIWIVHDKYKTTIARGPLTGHRWDVTIPSGVSKSSKWKQITTSSVFSPEHGSWVGLVWASRPNGEIFCFPSQDVATAHAVTLAPPVLDKRSIVCLSACKEALWVLFDDGTIYIRSGISADCIKGTEWSKLNTSEQLGDVKFIHLSCGTQNVWAVDSNGQVYFRIGVMSVDRMSLPPAWIPIDGCNAPGNHFTQVECGLSDGSVWALDNSSNVYIRTGVRFDFSVGDGWEVVPGSHSQQLCISNHTVWGLRTGGNLIRRFGISERNGMGDYWKKIRGKFKKIAVTPYDELWAIDNEEKLRHQYTTVYCPLVVEAQYKYESTNVAKFDFSPPQNTEGDWEFL